jgi:AraC-like DNA-binding protein
MYVEHRPSHPLSCFVQMFWYSRSNGLTHSRERILPNGSIQIVINLARDFNVDCVREERVAPALIAGMQTKYLVIDTGDLAEMIGVHFLPGGFTPFVPAAVDEFSNAETSLEDVWGPGARELRERLLEARDIPAKFALLEAMLIERRRRKFRRHPAMDHALSRFNGFSGSVCVAQVRSELGLSERRFAQVFREQVGVTPKLYCRIRRFQRAVAAIRSGVAVDWAEVALDCGYFDQSHFANDFRAFSGMTPTAYPVTKSPWINHVALS